MATAGGMRRASQDPLGAAVPERKFRDERPGGRDHRFDSDAAALDTIASAGAASDSTGVEVFELQERNARLLMQLREAEGHVAELRGRVEYLESLPPRVEVVHVAPQELKSKIQEQQDELRWYREQFAASGGDPDRRATSTIGAADRAAGTSVRPQVAPPLIGDSSVDVCDARKDERVGADRGTTTTRVEVVKQDRFVAVPRIEVRTVEVESVEKLNRLMDRIEELEQELKDRDMALCEWQAKCAVLEQRPPQFEIRTVEVESTPRILQLVSDLNEAEKTIVSLKSRVLTVEHEAGSRVEYVDKPVYIEVPYVEVQRVEVECLPELERARDLVQQKDQEIERLQGELMHARAGQRRLESQITDALSLSNTNCDLAGNGTGPRGIGVATLGSSGSVRSLASGSASSSALPTMLSAPAGGMQRPWAVVSVKPPQRLPRVPVQLYCADASDPLDVKLGARLRTMACRVPFQRCIGERGRYIFGTLPVHIQASGRSDEIMVQPLDQTSLQPYSLPTFLQRYEEPEFLKLKTSPTLAGALPPASGSLGNLAPAGLPGQPTGQGHAPAPVMAISSGFSTASISPSLVSGAMSGRQTAAQALRQESTAARMAVSPLG